MLNYNELANDCFHSTERSAVSKMLYEFEKFCPDEQSLKTKTKDELKTWCAAGGLNYTSTQRRLRWCKWLYETHLGITSPLKDVSYSTLDFSADLEKHYFKSEMHMQNFATRIAKEVPSRRNDFVYLVPAIFALAWEGFSQAEMLDIKVGGLSNSRQRILTNGKITRPLSIISYKTLRDFVAVRRRNNATDADPLFATQDGKPWSRENLSEMTFRFNEVALKNGKEFIMTKLAENAGFDMVREFREDMHATVEDAVVHYFPGNNERYIKAQGYRHWEKYFYENCT